MHPSSITASCIQGGKDSIWATGVGDGSIECLFEGFCDFDDLVELALADFADLIAVVSAVVKFSLSILLLLAHWL